MPLVCLPTFSWHHNINTYKHPKLLFVHSSVILLYHHHRPDKISVFEKNKQYAKIRISTRLFSEEAINLCIEITQLHLNISVLLDVVLQTKIGICKLWKNFKGEVLETSENS